MWFYAGIDESKKKKKPRMESTETNLRLYMNLLYAKNISNQQEGSIILKAVSEQ